MRNKNLTIDGEEPRLLSEVDGIVHEFHVGGFETRVAECHSIEEAATIVAKGRNHYLHKYPFKPRTYHPRIWRRTTLPLERNDEDALHALGRSMALLFAMLREILGTVEPDMRNAKTFGHRLRQFLILACTEVETSWAGVLKANHCSRPANGYSTNHYVRLLRPMRLDEWKVSVWSYQDYQGIVPFSRWNQGKPTESLSWYDAYNAVKHDREENLSEASMDTAILAAAALFVMAIGQFGPAAFQGGRYGLQPIFVVEAEPSWAPEQLYFGRMDRDKARRVDCPL